MGVAVSAAIVGSAVVGGVAANQGAKKAANATRDATALQVEEQRRQYDQTRTDFAPWREAGSNALNMLSDPLANFQASPDYQFRMTEGLSDLSNQFAMKGGGGNAMAALDDRRSNIASNEFGNWWNRMFSQAEAGRGATGAVGAAGQNSANNISNAYGQQGSNLAQIYGNQYANINNQVQGGISNMLYANQTMGNNNDWLQEVPYTPYRT